jgi:hypothetical protein
MPFRPVAVLLLTLSLALPLSAARRRAVRSPALEPIEHVFVVILENTDADVAENLPFLSRLASEGALLADYQSLTHPSQPNYIALAAGSTWGVDHDSVVTLDVPHLGDLLENAHRTWRVYAENYPGNCYLESATADRLYVRRHVPFLEFKNVVSDPARCASHVVDASVLDADIATRALPSFALYVPNQRNNGHDTTPGFADAWLESRFGALLKDSRFTRRTLFIVTFDESDSRDLRIWTLLWGTGVRQMVSTQRYDHYSLLRTIEELFGTGTLGQNDETADPISDAIMSTAWSED